MKVISEEVVSPLGESFWHVSLLSLGELLSDVGGVFGFFLGINLLQCMTTVWFRIIRSNTKAWIERHVANPRHYYTGPKQRLIKKYAR